MLRRRRKQKIRQKNRNNRKITLFDYLASSVPSDAHFVINKFGNYRRARDKKELSQQLRNFVKEFGENGLNALAEIHPDKNLLQLNCSSCKETQNNKQTKNIERKYYNADASNIDIKTNELRQDQIRNANFLIFGGMTLIALALIMKKQ
jgi:hypothetical protein